MIDTTMDFNFSNFVNNIRKSNKDKWYFINCDINGKKVEVKGYNTWLQIFKINGIHQNTCMGNSVKQFLAELDQFYKV